MKMLSESELYVIDLERQFERSSHTSIESELLQLERTSLNYCFKDLSFLFMTEYFSSYWPEGYFVIVERSNLNL